MPTDKDTIQQRQEEILEQIGAFSLAKLNDEYFELAEKMLKKLSRKRHVPFETGKIEIWAAAIIHALGMINFVFDREQNSHITVKEIHGFFETEGSAVSGKSKKICDTLKLHHWDDEFGTREIQARNPYPKYVDAWRIRRQIGLISSYSC